MHGAERLSRQEPGTRDTAKAGIRLTEAAGHARLVRSTSAMATKKNVLGLIDAGREIRRPPLVGMQFLHEGTVGASDVLRARPGLNAKDLIGLLFSHFAAAAARRTPAAPRSRIAL